MKTNCVVAWVVYKKTLSKSGKTIEMVSVCEQGEWDEMELACPGHYMLVRGDIANEPEAEALARDMSGYIATTRNHPYGRRTSPPSSAPLRVY